MQTSRRTVLTTLSTVGPLGLAGCLGVFDSCGPADTTVEDLTQRSPTGITQRLDDKLSLEGEIVAVADRDGETVVRIDDTTGVAELRSGPNRAWTADGLPGEGACVTAFGYHVDAETDDADAVMSDVYLESAD